MTSRSQRCDSHSRQQFQRYWRTLLLYLKHPVTFYKTTWCHNPHRKFLPPRNTHILCIKSMSCHSAHLWHVDSISAFHLPPVITPVPPTRRWWVVIHASSLMWQRRRSTPFSMTTWNASWIIVNPTGTMMSSGSSSTIQVIIFAEVAFTSRILGDLWSTTICLIFLPHTPDFQVLNHSVHTKLNKDLHMTYEKLTVKNNWCPFWQRDIQWWKNVQIQTSGMGYNWCRQRSVSPDTVG